MTAGLRTGLALFWLALLLVAGWLVSQHLQLSGDLRRFMPAQTENSREPEPEAARAAGGAWRPAAFASSRIVLPEPPR